MELGNAEFLKALLDGMPNPVVVAGRDHSVRFANSAARKAFARDTGAAERHTCHRLIYELETPCDAVGEPCPLEEVFRSGKTVTVYHQCLGRGAGLDIIAVSASPVFDAAGEVSAVEEVFHRVSESVIAERLMTLEQRLRGFSESAADALVTLDQTGMIVYANNAATELFGCPVEELVGKPATLLLPERLRADSGALLRRFREASVAARAERTAELVCAAKDGSEINVECSFSQWKTDEATYYSAVMRDATARRREMEELRAGRDALVKEHADLNRLFKLVEMGKREWEMTMDCVDDMVILTDARGIIRRCNKSFKDFSRMRYEDLLGKDCIEFLVDQGIEMSALLSKEIEVFFTPAQRWFRINTNPVREDGEHESGRVITIHDMTEIKLMTQKLEQTNREIEKAYSELKMTQAKILQQEKMASIGQLAAGVAHEINNPMGFIASNLGTLNKYLDKISGYIQVLAEVCRELREPAATERLAQARNLFKIDYVLDDIKKLIVESLDGTDRVKAIVQNLKSFSRVDQTEMTTADINECIETTLNIVWNELKYKATVKKEYGAPPKVRCYAQQINQVFMNLLVNAGQAIETGGVITIKTWEGENSVFASVSDTGSGIPEANLSRIFEPFFTTKDVGKGTGLGLSIAYDIIKKHHGEIAVRSEVGKGTTFTVRLPVKEGTES
jgi:two-component system, NtrC family, sensor kinase